MKNIKNMKNLFINSGIIILLLLLCNGCEKDFLDIKPKGQLIPETTEDYRLLLDMVHETNYVRPVSTLRTYGIANYLADDFQVADSANYSQVFGNGDLWNMFTWATEGFIYPDNKEDVDMQALYGQIYTMNSVILNVPDAIGSEDEKKLLISEAKVHRAFCYLALVNIYAKHYSENADTDLGVPLRLVITLSEPLARASVQEVYDQIIMDLSEAYPNLPDIGEYKHRPSKANAYGLLARTYLYIGDYEQSLTYANQALDITDFLYNNNEIMDAGNKMGLNAWYDDEMLLMKTTTTRTSGNFMYSHNYIYCSADIIESLFDTVNDLRYFNKFQRQTGSPNRYNYREGYNRWNGAFMYFPHVGVTTPEILLTAAECEARIGETSRAMQIVNRIRLNRYRTGTHIDLTVGNRGSAIQYVLDERRKELWARGLRWFDLKRLNAIEGANITIHRTFTDHSLSPGDKGWVMPFARTYIDLNPEIIQNEGYDD